MRWPAGAFIISIASSPSRLLRSDVVQGEITVQSKVIVMSEVPIPQLVPRSPSPLPTTPHHNKGISPTTAHAGQILYWNTKGSSVLENLDSRRFRRRRLSRHTACTPLRTRRKNKRSFPQGPRATYCTPEPWRVTSLIYDPSALVARPPQLASENDNAETPALIDCRADYCQSLFQR
jgi:hypothetical protein